MQQTYEVSVGIDALLNTVLVSHGQRALVVQSSGKHWYNAASLLNNLEKAGKIMGYMDLSSFLRRISIIRLCTSFALTNLLQRNGQPVGLIVSPGLVEKATRILAMLGLTADLVAAISTTDNKIDLEELGISIARLLDSGARCIGICFERTYFDQIEEHRVRDYIEGQYNPHSLGFVPTIISSGAAGLSDVDRLTEILVDGYIRRSLAKYLDYLQKAVSNAGFNGTVLIAEGQGILTPFFRQHPAQNVFAPQGALDTINRLLIEQTGLSNGVALAVGNTKGLISVVSNGKTQATQLEDLLSPRAMGGFVSILKRQNERFYLVHPDDVPLKGPACFGWGGQLPTLADALLITGHLGSQSLRFLHGSLSRDAAYKAFSSHYGQSCENLTALAYRACNDVIDVMTFTIQSRLKHSGMSDARPAFIACGPAGGLVACAVAERMGWPVVYALPGNSGSIMASAPMMMNLEQSFSQNLNFDAAVDLSKEFQSALLQLQKQSQRILRASRLEGFNSTQVGNRCKTGIISLRLTAKTAKLFKNIFFEAEQPDDDIIPPTESARAVYLGPNNGWINCRVYWEPVLKKGMALEGPALVESPETVYWIPPGWTYVYETEGFIRIERRQAP